MKAGKLDLKIIKILSDNEKSSDKDNKEKGLCLSEISRLVDRLPCQVYLRMKKMLIYGMVAVTPASPRTIYTLNINKKREGIFVKVTNCPKCGSENIVSHEQVTIQCNDCFTKSGKKTRYYAHGRRIKEIKEAI